MVENKTSPQYAAAGGSDDWARGGAGIKSVSPSSFLLQQGGIHVPRWVYLVELPGHGHGFLLPPGHIPQVPHQVCPTTPRWGGPAWPASGASSPISTRHYETSTWLLLFQVFVRYCKIYFLPFNANLQLSLFLNMIKQRKLVRYSPGWTITFYGALQAGNPT